MISGKINPFKMSKMQELFQMEQLPLERKRKLSMANVKRKYESQAKKDRRMGLILMIPIILVVFGIMGYPFCRALYLSFTNKVVGKPEEFVGLENYIKLFHDPIYWKSLKNTLVYTVGCIAAKLALGLLWAVLLNRSFKGKSFFRTVLLIPWAIPGMVAATTWRWMYDSTYGIINSLLISLGVTKIGIPWLSDPNLTLLTNTYIGTKSTAVGIK